MTYINVEVGNREKAKEVFEAILPFLTDEDIRDQYHTMQELYHYRMLYHAYAIITWVLAGFPVVKSKQHHDGTMLGEDWFIVTAELPTGQVSNHYKMEHWKLFNCPEVKRAPEWDGHTPAIAAERLHAMFEPPYVDIEVL